jgi:uncharacterized membrane protein YbhN (UPF0104 family)
VIAIRLFVIAVVFLAVHRALRHAVDELAHHDWQLRPAWLMLAGGLYAVGLVPMAWFWYRALAALGQPAPWAAVLRAYFLGHLGKYVPGKAMAVVLRVATIRKWVPSLRVAIVSAMLETLTMMAVGAFLAAALSIAVLQLEPRLAALAALMAIAAGVPTLPPIARRVARVGITRVKQETELELPPTTPADIDASLHGINLRLLTAGWIAAGTCWLLLGMSLWATLRGIGVEQVHPITDLPMLVAAVAIAVVAGFLSLLPGGLGVRDALLVPLLAPVCSAPDALVAAVLLRLVWLVSEVCACGILYVAARWEHHRTGSAHQDRSIE